MFLVVFFQLIRQVFRQSLDLVKRHGWQDAHIARLTYIMQSGIASGSPDVIPEGLQFHIADIYMEELENVGSQDVSILK